MNVVLFFVDWDEHKPVGVEPVAINVPLVPRIGEGVRFKDFGVTMRVVDVIWSYQDPVHVMLADPRTAKPPKPGARAT